MSKLVGLTALLCLLIGAAPAFAIKCSKCGEWCGGKGSKCLINCQQQCK
jgi:hypothetical protein